MSKAKQSLPQTPKPVVLRGEAGSVFINRISREYGIYVLYARAIPLLTDGLKMGQRIALWLIRNQSSDIKTISLAGDMIKSKLYVHGDSSAGDTISYLAAPYLNNIPLIQGEGQFGTRVAPVDGIGAPRYTEVKRSKFAEQHLYVDTDILPMMENYDGSVLMPATFLPLIPLVLLNGVKGIATGWATTILPRRFDDLVQAVQDVLRYGKVKTPLLPHYEQYDVDVIQSDESPNKYVIRGKLEIRNTSTVVITELPPDLTLSAFKEILIKLEEANQIEDFTDNTTDRVNIEIKMRRAVLAEMDESRLIEFFKLRSYVTENIVVLSPSGDAVIKYERAEDLIRDFVEWRLGWYTKRYEHLLEREEHNMLFWACYLACQYGSGKLTPLPERIRVMSGRDTIRKEIEKLIQAHKLDVESSIVEKLIDLPIYRWSKDQIEAAEKAVDECEKLIDEYVSILDDPKKQKAIYAKEVKA